MDNATFRRFCAANGVPLLDYDGSTPVGFINPRTNDSLLGIPSYTLATIPAAASTALGAWINIPKSEFTNPTGMAGDGIYLRNDGTYWRPAFEQEICHEEALPASYVATIAAGPTTITPFVLPNGEPRLPRQIINPGLVIGVEFIIKRHNANLTMTSTAHFGPTSNATRTNSGIIAPIYSGGATDNGYFWTAKEGRVLSATRYMANNFVTAPGATTANTGGWGERSFDIANYDCHLTFASTPAHASDYSDLMMYRMWVR